MRDAGLGLEVVQGGVQESAAVRTKVCWNVKCGTSSSTNWRPGWLLRAGHTADLCDSCGLAYEQSRFCETFHSDDAGWRTCNSCKKRVHCGCIASVYGLVLLDKGGVECSGCVQEDDVIASSSSLQAGKKHGQQQLLATALGHAANGKEVADPALRGWGEGGGYGAAALVACQSEPWQPPSSAAAAAACEPHANNARGQQLAAPWDPNLKIEQQLMESSRSLRPAAKFQDQEVGFPSNLELHANNLDSSMKSVAAGSIACSPKETRETAATAGGGKGPPESPPGHVESSSPSSKSGTDQMPTGLTLSGGSSPVKQVTGEGGQQGGASETGAAGESAGHGKASTTVGSYRPPRVRQLLPRPTIAGAAAAATLEPGFDAQAPPRVARPPGEGRGRNQLLPRYWPRITDQELQQIASGDSNTVITPLFEKMLSASDAGRIGRLVLPKACAEAYFPPIHQPEGLPLKIQDVTGKEWVFQFRFWPNNNSRMYVLEGVTPCIQSMRLQAGDTVTFSRLEADGKLVMGYRRAPSSLSSQDATGIATTPPSNNGLPCASYAAPQSLDGWASSKGGASAKLKDSSALTLAAAAATQQMDRKRGRPLGSKSKRLRLDTDDALLLKSSWEEAQELLRPPPSAVPTTITIDGHEFEEYSEPPVFAKKTYPNITPSGEHEQWAQCDECGNWRRLPATAFVPLHWSCSQNTWDLTRAQCNAPQEVSNEKLEMILRQVSGQEDGKQGGGSGSGSMRMMLVPTVAGDINTTTAATAAAAAAGLDTLAQAAAATTTGPVSPMRTTKHPRHRPGCSCIVCIQPPSGKGPKHKATCTCNVCVTVKRRFKTLMQRRKKRQFERESELARKKRGWARDDISDSASLLDAASRPETSAGGGGGGGGGGAVGEENPTTPLVYQSDDVGGGADEGGPSKAAATAAAIDLNSQPDRDERVSMVRLVQDAGKPLSTYLHQQHLMTLCAPDHPLSDKVSEEEDPNSSSSREEVASQTSSKAHADSGMQLVAAAAVTPMQQGQQQQPQSPFMVDIAELSSHMESWDPRAVKAVAEPSGDSVHSSSSKQEYNMLNQLVVSNAPASSKKYATGAGRGRQICSGCGEPIGSAAKVCRRCGTSTAFGKKKRSVPP